LPKPLQHVPIYLQQFPSYSNRKCKKSLFSRTAAHIFVSPGDAPALITQYVPWMEREFNACQTPRSMYLSIFNSFRVVRYLSQCVSPKIAIFTYHSRHFCFSWRCPCDYDEICCMDGKTIQCLPNQGSMYPSIFNIFRVIPTASAKNCRFHVPQLTFLFPLETPLRLLRNVLHGWKDNSMLAKPLAAYSYLSSIVSELYDA